MLRSLRNMDDPFGVEFIARQLSAVTRPSRAAKSRAKRLIHGLIASGLVARHEGERGGDYILTDTGTSLRAANATKRFKRARGDRAVANLLEVVTEINADPIYLHDIPWVAVFGSYVTDAPDLGDLDIGIELRARWKRGGSADYGIRKRRFEANYPPPVSFYQKWWWASWPETYTKRRLRVDPGIKLIERLELERLGCPHRVILPAVADVAAKPGWAFASSEIVLTRAVSIPI